MPPASRSQIARHRGGVAPQRACARPAAVGRASAPRQARSAGKRFAFLFARPASQRRWEEAAERGELETLRLAYERTIVEVLTLLVGEGGGMRAATVGNASLWRQV